MKTLAVLIAKQGRKYGLILPEGTIITKHMPSFKIHTIQIPRKIRILRFFYFNNAFADITINRKMKMQKYFTKLDMYFFSKHIEKKNVTKTCRSSP